MYFLCLSLRFTFKIKVFSVFLVFLGRGKRRNTVVENHHFYIFKYVWLYIIFLEIVLFSEKFKNPKKPIFLNFLAFGRITFQVFLKNLNFAKF